MVKHVYLLITGVLLLAFSNAWSQPVDTIKPTFAEPIVDTSIHIPLLDDTASVTVRTLIITGNRKTKDAIIIREIALAPNTPYNGKDFNDKVRLTKEQLMNTKLFITVDVAWKEVPLTGEYDIIIDVKERWYFFPVPYFKVVDRNWNVWINDYKASLSRTNYGIKLFHTNLSGRNDKLDVWIIGGYTQQLEFKYQLPFADRKLEKGYNFGMSYGRNRELNYATDSNRQQFAKLDDFGRTYFRTEVDFSYRRGSNQRIYLRAIYGTESIDSAFYYLNPNFLNGKTKASYLDFIFNYQYWNVDYIPFPLRGWFVDVNLFRRFSTTIPTTSISGRAQAAWRFMPKTYISLQTAFSWSFPREQPYYNQRLMGYGSLYMQGLEYYVMDGTFGVMGRTTLRRELFTITFRGPESWKAYSRIPFKFYAKTYGNIGYAYNIDPGTNYMNNRFLHTGGFGLEIATIYDFVFKLEYSFNQFNENGLFIHSSSDF